MITLETLALSEGLVWVDETEWTPVAQETSYSLAGSLLVETSLKKTGRPVTLSGGENCGWVTRATVLALMELAADPGREMSLTLNDDRQFTVIFRHGEGSPVEARQVVPYSLQQAGHYYTLTLRLTIVDEESTP